jgi:hypothetical protein
MMENCRVSAYLDSDTVILLRRRSDEEGRKRSHLVREAVQEFLLRNPKPTDVRKWLDSYWNWPRWPTCYTLPTEVIEGIDRYIYDSRREHKVQLTRSEILRYVIYMYLHSWAGQ